MGVARQPKSPGGNGLRSAQAGGLSYPLRRTLEFNEELAESYFRKPPDADVSA
jgi:hypothetical protein